MLTRLLAVLAMMVLPASVLAEPDLPTQFTLSYAQDNGDGGSDVMPSWDVEGPYRFRSVDVQETGTMDLKLGMRWSTASDGTDDDVYFRPTLQYGIAENHELILSFPMNLGDGGRYWGDGREGNGDAHLGWQWKLVEESDSWVPAIAIYNEFRLPTGWKSNGVDWELMGIFSQTVAPDTRLHLNPFIKVIGQNFTVGDSDDWFGDVKTSRDFKAGLVLGCDRKFTWMEKNMVFNADYILDSGDLNGYRMQHEAQLGVDWLMSERETLSVIATIGLDGDSQGDNFGLGFQYALSLDAPWSF